MHNYTFHCRSAMFQFDVTETCDDDESANMRALHIQTGLYELFPGYAVIVTVERIF